MFIYNFKNGTLPDIAKFKENINTELKLIENQLNNQTQSKDIIYKSFVDMSIIKCVENTDSDILSDFNDSFYLINSNIQKLELLKTNLIEFKSYIDNIDFNNNFDEHIFLATLQEKLEDYYNIKNNIEDTVLGNTNELDNNLDALDEYIETNPVTQKNQELIEKNITAGNFSKIDITYTPEEIKENITNIKDNRVLLISEKENKVYLPYLVTDLKDILNQNEKYQTLEELINEEYIIPLNKLKSSFRIRFIEGYKLIRKKEQGSFKEAVFLGLELMNNYRLNPAVISACKNEDELDIYLDESIGKFV